MERYEKLLAPSKKDDEGENGSGEDGGSSKDGKAHKPDKEH